MIRVIITVKKPDEIASAYRDLQELEELQVIHVKSNLFSEVQDVCINVIYKHGIIGEILIVCNKNPINYSASLLLETLKDSKTVAEFKQHILFRVNDLAENSKIYIPHHAMK